MLRALKDRAVAAAVTAKLSRGLGEYCDMFRFTVDSQAKILVVEAMPKGETEMIRLEVLGYRFERQGERAALVFDELRVSRAWMQSAARALLKDKRIVLPEAVPFDLIATLL